MNKYLEALDFQRILARSLHDTDPSGAALAFYILDCLEPLVKQYEQAVLDGVLPDPSPDPD